MCFLRLLDEQLAPSGVVQKKFDPRSGPPPQLNIVETRFASSCRVKHYLASLPCRKLMQSEVREKQRVCFGERFLAGTRAAGQRGSLYGAVGL